MKIFNELLLRFTNPTWELDPELALFDTILENHPELIDFIKDDLMKLGKNNELGRKDSPTVEQILRAAMYKELKGLKYRELEYHQYDSKICGVFIKLDGREPFSFEVLQKYIAAISHSSLKKIMEFNNKIAHEEKLEDFQKVRIDPTVVETNIHYPTNNSLIWDCIKTSHKQLSKISDIEISKGIRNYKKQAKKHFFEINVTKDTEKRKELFQKQIRILDMSIHQAERVTTQLRIKEKCLTEKDCKIKIQLDSLLVNMKKVRDISYRHQILEETVPNEDKIFSIYEPHTDIIVKGQREVKFGHKVNLATGKSSLILFLERLEGNPAEKNLYEPAMKEIICVYGTVPRDSATDGGLASKANIEAAKKLGIKNIVFNKIVGSMKNVVTSKNMETRLKKWRSGIEGNISALKRGFNLARCSWKNIEHFDAKLFWSAIAYNLRVMSCHFLKEFEKQLV